MNEPHVEATKTSLELGPGMAMRSTPVVGVSLIKDTVGPTTQETSAQARPPQRGGLFSSTPVTWTLGSNQRQASPDTK